MALVWSCFLCGLRHPSVRLVILAGQQAVGRPAWLCADAEGCTARVAAARQPQPPAGQLRMWE